jgi:flagellar biosynthesis chaperone FliJ
MDSSLATALRIRKLAVEEARLDLALRLDAEAQAAAAERQAAHAIQHEATAATEADASDAAVEAFAAWLPRGRQALKRAQATRAEAEVACNLARAAVAAAQSAYETVETLLVEQAEAARQRTARAEQKVADETALLRWSPLR